VTVSKCHANTSDTQAPRPSLCLQQLNARANPFLTARDPTCASYMSETSEPQR